MNETLLKEHELVGGECWSENLTQKAAKARNFGVFFSRFLREKFTQLDGN